jgi:hypothetical protein
MEQFKSLIGEQINHANKIVDLEAERQRQGEVEKI